MTSVRARPRVADYIDYVDVVDDWGCLWVVGAGGGLWVPVVGCGYRWLGLGQCIAAVTQSAESEGSFRHPRFSVSRVF